MGELQKPREKMSLFSDELWLIDNNSKSFENGGKSIRSNLGLCKHLTMFDKNIFKNLMV